MLSGSPTAWNRGNIRRVRNAVTPPILRALSYCLMTDDQTFLRPGPHLSSVVGLQEAGVLESVHFDPVRGLVGVVYSPAYLEILRSGVPSFLDPVFVAAMSIDDPIAMRIWVSATAARISGS